MLEHLELFFKSIFVDNMVFAVFLGMCSYLAVSKKVSTAVGLGAAVIFVLGLSVCLSVFLLVRLYVCRSVCLYLCLFACHYACLSVCLSVCLPPAT